MLTIVIPTKNRSFFINRALKYYAEVLCPFPIVIGDSSDGVHLQRNKSIIDEVGSRLKISHIVDYTSHENKNLVGWQKEYFLCNLIGYVETPYVAFYADDDFAIVNNLQSAIDFLEVNKEYSFVCGEAILFELKDGVAHGEMSGVSRYSQREITSNNASQRILDLYSNYTVVEYGISRTGQKKYRWNKIFEYPIDNYFGELMNCGLVVVQGKVKKMDKLFLVRQGHALQTSRRKDVLMDWIEKSIITDGYRRLRDVISHELVVKQRITLEEANEIVKKGFWLYLAKGLMNTWNKRYSDTNKSYYSRLKEVCKKTPCISQILRQILTFMPRGQMSLHALLRKTSVYHQDFIPVYKIVTKAAGVLNAVNDYQVIHT